jgi:hypothetical protein
MRQTVLRLHGMGMAIELAEITGLMGGEVGTIVEASVKLGEYAQYNRANSLQTLLL